MTCKKMQYVFYIVVQHVESNLLHNKFQTTKSCKDQFPAKQKML